MPRHLMSYEVVRLPFPQPAAAVIVLLQALHVVIRQR